MSNDMKTLEEDLRHTLPILKEKSRQEYQCHLKKLKDLEIIAQHMKEFGDELEKKLEALHQRPEFLKERLAQLEKHIKSSPKMYQDFLRSVAAQKAILHEY